MKNDVAKRAVYDKLAKKVNNIDTSRFASKTKYEADKSDLEKKIPHTSGIVKKTDYHAKITEIESKILRICGLATTSALTAVENKIPNVSNLVKKQIMTQRLLKLKRNLPIKIMMNILLFLSLII